MNVSRRGLLRGAGAGVVLIGSTEMLAGCAPAAAPGAAVEPGFAGYGELVADPKGMLALPKDFRYTVVTHAGVTTLDSGEPTPRNHDGTGAFAVPAVASCWSTTTRSASRSAPSCPCRTTRA